MQWRKHTGSVESLHDWTSVPNSTRLPLLLLVLCLVWKAEYLFGAIIGIDILNYPFPDQRVLGAYLGIAIVVLWLAREPFAQVIQSAVESNNETRMNRCGIGLLF